MRQMNLKGLEIVQVDILWSKLPALFYDLRPSVYKDGNAFCCLFGPDPQQGVFGCGESADEAIRDWNSHLQELLENQKETTEVLQYIRDHIARTRYDRDNRYKGEF